jgi:hypothetical protein
MTENIERRVIDLVATDRIYVPLSSFDAKLKRSRPKMAHGINSFDGYDNGFEGDRAYARTENRDVQKARGMRDGVNEFSQRYPKYGKILNGIIEEKRTQRETHLYFGMNEGKRLTKDDYVNVMTDLGLSEQRAQEFYPIVMDISRNLTRKRKETERSILIG